MKHIKRKNRRRSKYQNLFLGLYLISTELASFMMLCYLTQWKRKIEAILLLYANIAPENFSGVFLLGK